jgi:hypothetical protein
LDDWAWFIRDHKSELAEALGPNFHSTKQKFEEKSEESREIAARPMPKLTVAGRLRHFRATAPGMIVMGPLGWIVAAGLVAFNILAR